MESKKINQLATEFTPVLSDITIIGDPTTGVSKKITLSQMASLFTGTVEEYPNFAAFPLVGTADTIYIALDTNVLYRWNTGTNAYVELSPNIINSLVFSDANGFDGNISLVGSTATLTITTALTTGSVPFIGTSGALSQDNANLFFDDTNNRLGINTNAPTTALDVFGSGIIERLNGTSTNNSFLGFASAGTNKWSIGNVQSDHRFRIYSEANTAELVSVLQTGEFGIGIANPTTKFHIDGAASALIANLDANVSVAKSVSFRSDNSNRINLEVSGTESGSNAGANFFIRRYSDAGALIDTPLTITRSTGAITLATALSGTSATFSGNVTANNGSVFLAVSSLGTVFTVMQSDNTSGYIGTNTNHPLILRTDSTTRLTISASTGAATFSSSVTATQGIFNAPSSTQENIIVKSANTGFSKIVIDALTSASSQLAFLENGSQKGAVGYRPSTGNIFLANATGDVLHITSTGNVGIGTNTTNTLLNINIPNSSTNGLSLIDGPTVPAVFTYSSETGENRIGGLLSYVFLTFYSGGTERIRIISGGNVGIGTSSPTDGKLVVSNAGPAIIALKETSVGVHSHWNASDGSNTFFGNVSNHPLTFITNNTERMRITSGGNVGIGTSSPNSVLEVYGQTRISASLGSVLLITPDATSTNGVTLDTSYYGSAGYGPLKINAGGAERMRITSGGTVLIGTTSNSGVAKLEMDGDLLLKGNGGVYYFESQSSANIYAWYGSTSQIRLFNNTIGVIGYFNDSTGVYTAINPSDIRIKDNVRTYNKGLNELLKINVKQWEYNGKAGTCKGEKGVGFIANEMENAIPEWVGDFDTYLEKDDTEKTKLKNINVNELPYLMLKSIQEIVNKYDAKIEELNAKIEELKKV